MKTQRTQKEKRFNQMHAPTQIFNECIIKRESDIAREKNEFQMSLFSEVEMRVKKGVNRFKFNEDY